MAVASIAHDQLHVTVGIETHKYSHTGHAKDQLGRDLGRKVEMLRALRVARRTATKARTQAINAIRR